MHICLSFIYIFIYMGGGQGINHSFILTTLLLQKNEHTPDSSTTGNADILLSTNIFKALMIGVSGCMKAML